MMDRAPSVRRSRQSEDPSSWLRTKPWSRKSLARLKVRMHFSNSVVGPRRGGRLPAARPGCPVWRSRAARPGVRPRCWMGRVGVIARADRRHYDGRRIWRRIRPRRNRNFKSSMQQRRADQSERRHRMRAKNRWRCSRKMEELFDPDPRFSKTMTGVGQWTRGLIGDCLCSA
jgi:hypothetical protein